MNVSKRLEGIGEYYFSQKLREIDELNKQGKQIINLGIGSPDLPPHPDVVKILHEESLKESTHAYQGYKGSPVLRKAVSDWYKKCYSVNLDADSEILPLIGSKEGIMHICMTFLNEGDEVLIPNPGYPTYKAAVTIAGGVCINYDLSKEQNWFPDFETLEKTDLNKVKLMFVNYPHMPTGQLPVKEMFINLVAFAKRNNILLIHDNAYSFILNEKPMSLLAIDGAKDCVLELNSLSKSHNMAGWRIGMLCAAKQFIDEVLRFKSNMDSGMFLPLQLAAAKALELGKDWHDSINKIYKTRREKVFELLDILKCTYSKDQAGLFIWAAIPVNCKDGYELCDQLLYQSNVFITPGGIFGTAGEKYMRISLCSKEETIQEAINRINNNLRL